MPMSTTPELDILPGEIGDRRSLGKKEIKLVIFFFGSQG